MSKKQAIVLIHGIGEQVPMDTLRGFVDAVWVQNSSARWHNVPGQAWSKPDQISGDYELRRLTTAANKDGLRTDFFEFYWAHMMAGTTLSHVSAWVRVLLFRWPSRVPGQLRGIWWTLWFLAVAGIVAGLNQKFHWVAVPSSILAAIGIAWFLLGAFLTGLLVTVAGDAARYLHVAPPNIEIRRKIRQAGIDLLQKLHDSKEYDRIVVAGHSLGSVIGYDILTHLWPRYHDAHVNSGTAPSAQPVLEKIEDSARRSHEETWSVKDYQELQAEYREELARLGNRWLITDFVTLGSPLVHAAVLMARDEEQFTNKKMEREFPTCPPTLETIEKKGRFSYEKVCNHDQAMQWVPHHAAVFGPTRWTNLYFPCHFTLWGDVIGGPVAPAFGPGVRDLELEMPLRWGLLSHTLYWTFPREKYLSFSWIHTLRDAIGICGERPPVAEVAPTPVAMPMPGSATVATAVESVPAGRKAKPAPSRRSARRR